MDGNKNDSREPLKLSQEDLEALLESTLNDEIQAPQKKTPKDTPKTPYFEASFSGQFSKNEVDIKPTDLPDSQGENFKADGDSTESRSRLGKKYDEEVEHIKATHGDLEKIRRQLKLSKRKISQLLMVDPSAWTRWTRKKSDAPPHIYRALQWYLLLQERHPEYRSSLWLNSIATPQISEHELENLKTILINRIEQEIEGKKDNFFEEQSLNDRHLQKQLNQAHQKIETLNKRIKWLLYGQYCLIAVFLTFYIVMSVRN